MAAGRGAAAKCSTAALLAAVTRFIEAPRPAATGGAEAPSVRWGAPPPAELSPAQLPASPRLVRPLAGPARARLAWLAAGSGSSSGAGTVRLRRSRAWYLPAADWWYGAAAVHLAHHGGGAGGAFGGRAVRVGTIVVGGGAVEEVLRHEAAAQVAELRARSAAAVLATTPSAAGMQRLAGAAGAQCALCGDGIEYTRGASGEFAVSDGCYGRVEGDCVRGVVQDTAKTEAVWAALPDGVQLLHRSCARANAQ